MPKPHNISRLLRNVQKQLSEEKIVFSRNRVENVGHLYAKTKTQPYALFRPYALLKNILKIGLNIKHTTLKLLEENKEHLL